MPHSKKGEEEETVPIDSESVKQNNSAVRGSESEKAMVPTARLQLSMILRMRVKQAAVLPEDEKHMK
jgi:hypothetical protein